MLINILQIGGAALVVAGVALMWVPAGVIAAGAFAILFGMSLERR